MNPTTLILYGLSIICLLPYIHLAFMFLLITLRELSYSLSQIITNLLNIICFMIFYCPILLLALIYLIKTLI
jgi:hypothetical protein